MLQGLRNEVRPPYGRETLWADLKAGVTLVASYLPTAMALGVISGMGPLAGLWCGVFVGIIAAVFGGTRALVSGPSAVLAVITATLLMDNEVSLPELAVIIALAGAFQMALGLAGVGRFVSYMPHIVLTGFMSGIGVLLLWNQVEKLFGFGIGDLVLAALCLSVFFLWPNRVDRFIPAPLAAVGIGWVVAHFIPGIHQLGPVPVGLPIPVLELPSLDFLPEAVGAGDADRPHRFGVHPDVVAHRRYLHRLPAQSEPRAVRSRFGQPCGGTRRGAARERQHCDHDGTPLRRENGCCGHHLPDDHRGAHPGSRAVCGTVAVGGVLRDRPCSSAGG